VTLFEYLAIAYSLVFSFAALRLVAGLPHAIESNRRYFVHVAHVCILLFSTAAVFWAQWSARDLEWTFPRFLIQLAGPGVLYFLACTLIPDEPSSVRSWQDYFFSVRKRYFGGICVWALIMATNATVLVGVPLSHPVRLVQLGVLILGAAGLATDRPSAHRMILICGAVVLALAVLVILQPGPLAAQQGVGS
jgi:hypothetical protein